MLSRSILEVFGKLYSGSCALRAEKTATPRKVASASTFFGQRMQALNNCGLLGQIGACYVTWLLLVRAQPTSQERDLWMANNTMKLGEAVRHLEGATH